ncbi:golgin candidate 5-like [Olea europaea var. sylvestris]|uniref:golgin candidate 5-like n=1 Tax=Olea europaea var. sylvestris TaxID=158386 RepID=UPI000C1D2B34|nr:golgin candidate 5-like [Olea europaea var. sylvestris]
MAWFSGKVSLGNFPDLAGAVNKLSESVKNIEKNFDTALGLEEKSEPTSSTDEGLWPSATDRKALFEPIMGFMGNKGGNSIVESLAESSSSKPASPLKEEESSSSKPASSDKEESSFSKPASPVMENEVIDNDSSANITIEKNPPVDEANEETKKVDEQPKHAEESKDVSGKQKDAAEYSEGGADSLPVPVELSEQNVEHIEQTESAMNFEEKMSEEELPKTLELVEPDSASPTSEIDVTAAASSINEVSDLPESMNELNSQEEDVKEISTAQELNVLTDGQAEKGSDSPTSDEVRIPPDYSESSLPDVQYEDAKPSVEVHENDAISEYVEVEQQSTIENEVKEQQHSSSGSNSSDVEESAAKLEKIKKDMKTMEIALQGAARQAQAKADEIAKLMNENEQLKAVIEDLRKVSYSIRELQGGLTYTLGIPQSSMLMSRLKFFLWRDANNLYAYVWEMSILSSANEGLKNMAWFSGKVSLGNFPDLAGAVNKLSESVKNIEKNFDTALGLEEKSEPTSSTDEGLWPSATDRKALFEPIMGFMGNKGGNSIVESLTESSSSKPASPLKEEESSSSKPASSDKEESSFSKPASPVMENEVIDNDSSANITIEKNPPVDEANEETKKVDEQPKHAEESKDVSGKQKDAAEYSEGGADSLPVPVELSEQNVEHIEQTESAMNFEEKMSEEELPKTLELVEPDSASPTSEIDVTAAASSINEVSDLPESMNELNSQEEDVKEISTAQELNVLTDGQAEKGSDSPTSDEVRIPPDYSESSLPDVQYEDAKPSVEVHENDAISEYVEVEQQSTIENEVKEQQHSSSGSNSSDVEESAAKLEKIKKDMKTMEIALQGAARQAQAKADEIAKLMNENEQLKAVIEDLRKIKSNEAEIESLREDYHQRVATLERKVYALAKERDALRREQSKKIDAAALLKEKDEIITQVMAEGEELSKKQAAQESHMRKLRAQIRELEEEKKGLLTKLQVILTHFLHIVFICL